MIKVTVQLLVLLLELRDILKRIVPQREFERKGLLSLMLRLDNLRDDALRSFLLRSGSTGDAFSRLQSPQGNFTEQNEFLVFDVKSSLARQLLYSITTRELRVVFTSGKVHSYLNVPHQVFEQVLYGEGYGGSVGAAYNALVRGNLDYAPAPVENGERVPEKLFTVSAFGTSREGVRRVVVLPVMATSRRAAHAKVLEILNRDYHFVVINQVVEGSALAIVDGTGIVRVAQ
jgi:hypothetical protein